MGIVGEGEAMPTSEDQDAAEAKRQEDLAAERELHAKMRFSASPDFPGWARDKKEETEEAS